MHARNKTSLIAATAVLLLAPSGLWAQARSRYVWNNLSLQGLRTIGGDFGLYASGLGGLGRTGRYGGGTVLRSSMRSPGGYRLSRSGAGGGRGVFGGFSRSTSLSQRVYSNTPLGKLTVPLNAQVAPTGPMKIRPESLLSLRSYLAAMGHTSALKEQSDKPITSLVPEDKSVYQEHMQRGDANFRKGKFSQALGNFNVAVAIARYAPEAHLCVTHAAVATNKYYKAAYHLCKALEYFPELPLVRMSIRGFYSDSLTYVKHVEALRKRAESPRADAGVWLLLAYYRYFDGKEVEAAAALRKAFRLSGDEDMTEAVRTFWDGMVAAGKVSGALEPTSQPTAARAEGGVVPSVPAGGGSPTTRPSGG